MRRLSCILDKREVMEVTYGGALGSPDILRMLRGRRICVRSILALKYGPQRLCLNRLTVTSGFLDTWKVRATDRDNGMEE